MKTFPDGFLWGTAASAYQIEGAVDEDGRGKSVWDTFAHTPGRILNGDTGDVACDHYHRYEEDVALLKRLGVGAYRFSVAWPRVLPEGTGAINEPGLAFYDRLVDALLAAGIEPWCCLHHWDMPQAIEDRGGWRSRDCAQWFADYAAVVVERLSDRVKRYGTFNEPNVVPWVGYAMGVHAPGRRSRAETLAAMHHINLAHGRTVAAIRAIDPALEVGSIISKGPIAPALDDAAHREAAALLDVIWRRVMCDPLWLGRYPAPFAEEIAPLVEDGDMALISAPLDYFGLNHYNRSYAAPDPENPLGVSEAAPPAGTSLTSMGWEIDPAAFGEQLRDVRDRYGNPPVYVTENGAAFPDATIVDGRVQDDDRIAFLQGYIGAMHDAIQDGCDVRGYFVWSFLDNFEWSLGYDLTFGLTSVTPGSLERVPKASFDWMRGTIAANAVA